MTIDSILPWALFLGVVLIVFVSIEAGYRLGRYARRQAEDELESPSAAIAGSILGLGAFLLAFTFGIVANRYDAKKELVRNEANAIRTTWLRSEFLPEPDRTETRTLIRRYLDERLAFAQLPHFDPRRAKGVLARANEDQARLWEIAVANARKDMNSDVAALYIESLNELFALHTLRVVHGMQTRIPIPIWILLLALTSMGMSALGYQTGIAGSVRSKARPFLAVAFALVIALIADLDLPGGGLIRVSQQPLIDAQSWMSEGARIRRDTPVENRAETDH